MFNTKRTDAKENLEPNSRQNGSATNDINSGFKSLNLANFVLSPFPTSSTEFPTSTSSPNEITSNTINSNEGLPIVDGLNEIAVERPLTFSEILYNNNNGKHFSAPGTIQNNKIMSNNQLSNFSTPLPNTMTSIWSQDASVSTPMPSANAFLANPSENNNKFNNDRYEQLPPTVSDEPAEHKFGAIGSNVPASEPSNPSNPSTSSSPFSLIGINGNNSPPEQIWLGAVGNTLALNASNRVHGSPDSGVTVSMVRSNGTFPCSFCRNDAQYYCNNCNDGMCGVCIAPHSNQTNFKQHRIQKLHSPSPRSWWYNPMARTSRDSFGEDRDCPLHYEILQFVCENCKVIVCQGCTLRDHYDHKCASIEEYIKEPGQVIKDLLDKSEIGKQEIKRMIDRVVVCTNYLERDMADIAATRRRNPRVSSGMLTPQQAEEQESYISEILEKFRVAHQNMFADKTSGLRSSLAGIASVTDELRRRGVFEGLDSFALAKKLIEHDNKIEHHLKQYSKLAPTQVDVGEFYQRLMSQFDDSQNSLEQLAQNLNGVNAWNVDLQTLITNANQLNLNGNNRGDRVPRRAIVARNHQPNNTVQSFFSQLTQQNQFWNPHTVQTLQNVQVNNKLVQVNKLVQNAQQMHTAHGLHLPNDFQNQLNVNELIAFAAAQPIMPPPPPPQTHLRAIHKEDKFEPNPGYGQCIYNLGVKVSVNHRFIPTQAFAGDGCEEGQLSRPWGVCVDKYGQIIIGDRRNNRIQIFTPSGEFKFAFGTKGTGDGELDLPAGVTVDIQNRIIVADKDNHRVQIFSSIGRFILKFGSYGRGLGEFQYPWDVATNTSGHIIVSDTRNHRVQMFTAYGHFITKFSFDDIPGPSGLKTNITPRGVCYDSNGDIFVTDFENHRIMKLDGNLRRVLMIRGREGYGDVLEFNRPSGICCDDKGLFVMADSKNQRVLVYNTSIEFQYVLDLRRTLSTSSGTDKDRPSDVALLPDGRIVVLFETSPDSKECLNPLKTFVQVY